jgi:predicted DNA-binding transcriptional regulator AlpA
MREKMPATPNLQETAKALGLALIRAFSSYPNGKRFLTEEELSSTIDIPAQTLATMRCRGKGPRYVKRGRLIRYDWNDVVEWMERHKVKTIES